MIIRLLNETMDLFSQGNNRRMASLRLPDDILTTNPNCCTAVLGGRRWRQRFMSEEYRKTAVIMLLLMEKNLSA